MEVQDLDGNVAEMNDQGGVLDAPNSQESASATEPSAPRAPENSNEPKAAKVEVKPAFDYEKSYKELERTYTRDRQEHARLQKEIEQYAPYKDKIQSWAQADKILTEDPVSLQYLQARRQGYSHAQAQSLAEESQTNPHLSAMAQELGQLKQYVQSSQQKEVQAQADQFLTKQMSAANEVYKQYLGKELTGDENAAIYKYMVEHNTWNAKAAVSDLFRDQIIDAKVQKVLEDQKSKGQKVVQRTSTQNSSTAKAPKGTMNLKDALYAAFDEHGIQ